MYIYIYYIYYIISIFIIYRHYIYNISLKTDISNLRNLQRTATNKMCKKVYTARIIAR